MEETEIPTVSIGIFQDHLDDVALVALLKFCATRRDLYKGSRLHAKILEGGLLQVNPFVGNTLINMYTKCGALGKVQQVFDDLLVKNVVSWTALITGYCEHGHYEAGLSCFEQMKHERLSPDAMAYASVLKTCGSLRAADKGREFHAEIVTLGFPGEDIVLVSALLDMYIKCGTLGEAQLLFHELLERDIVSWNVVISGYALNGHGEKALNCVECMQQEGFPPNAVTFASILKACGSTGATRKGKEVHAKVIGEDFLGKDIVLGSALVDMYAKCGSLRKARQVFDELYARNEVSWTSLIAGYSQHGYAEDALCCFQDMKREGLTPDRVTLACILQACGSLKAIEKGQEVHREIVMKGLLGKDAVLGNALVDMYVKCGVLVEARAVFDQLPVQDVVSWNVLVTGYSQHGQAEEVLNSFQLMQQRGLSPNAVTFSSALKACCTIGEIDKAMEVHAEIVRAGLLGLNATLGSALVDTYAKCNVPVTAQEVFYELAVREVVSWNALIAGYCENEHGEKGMCCYEQMKCEGICPDGVTLACTLKACGSMGAAEKGKGLHAEVVNNGTLGVDIVLGNALLQMYRKCGALITAYHLFEELPVRDVVSWNELVTTHFEHCHSEAALNFLKQMEDEGRIPDVVTFIGSLKACFAIGATERGMEVHSEVVRKGMLGGGSVLGNVLVDMYCKCGLLVKAQQVFDELPVRTAISWNTLITGHCRNGNNEEVLKCVEWMKSEGLSPDAVTWVCILKAYGGLGAAEKGQEHVHVLKRTHGIIPTSEHHACMVDVLARSGQFDKAIAQIEHMPNFDHLPVWSAVLGACLNFGNLKVGRWAFDRTQIV